MPSPAADLVGALPASIRFDTVALIFCVVPLAVLLWVQVRGMRNRRAIALSGLEYARLQLPSSARRHKNVRLYLWGVIVCGLAILWAGPVLRTPEPIFLSGIQTHHKHFVVALDVSPSMNLAIEKPKTDQLDLAARERAARGLSLGDEGATRFEVARNALYNFVERFGDAKIGLILFSTGSFIARWPTIETADKFSEVLDENIRRGNGSQLEFFAGLTNIQTALDQARHIFEKMPSAEGRAVILISDAEDQVEHMGDAAQRLREQGIRLYTIGVGVPAHVVDVLSKRFAADPGFRIFHVESSEEMSEAYLLIGALEESPALAMDQNEFVVDLRSILSLLFVFIFGGILWVLESRFHQISSGTPRAALRGRHDGLPVS